MNEQHDPDHDEQPAFDDPDHAWVRDLLADARVTSPVPQDVAARLDDTLAALQAERTGGEAGSGATVVPLRRRLTPRLAAAAAAVIVAAAGGVAVAQLGGGGGAGTSESAGSTADRSADKAGTPAAPGLTSGQGPQALSDAVVPQLSRASFAADAAAVMRRVAASGTAVNGLGDTVGPATPGSPAAGEAPKATEPQAPVGSSASGAPEAPPVTAIPPGIQPDLRSPAAAACAGPAAGGAVTLPATLDGTRVALVFRPPTAAGQRVEAWSCDGSTMLAGATIAP